MIVCHCFSVSDRQIRQCAKEGACTAHEVGRACGAGTGCGGCRPEIVNILGEVQKAEAPALGLLPVLQTG